VAQWLPLTRYDRNRPNRRQDSSDTCRKRRIVVARGAPSFRECRVTFRDVRDIQHPVTVHAETTTDAAALGLKRIREQQFVTEDLADPVTVELVTSTQHKVSLKKVMEWMAHAGGVSPKEIAMKARVREG
jgi:hypothetical protein